MKATRRSGYMGSAPTQWSFQCEQHLEKEDSGLGIDKQKH